MNDHIAYQAWKSNDRHLALVSERRRKYTEALERRRISGTDRWWSELEQESAGDEGSLSAERSGRELACSGVAQ